MWRPRFWPTVSALLAAVVVAPAITASPQADERFGIYSSTGRFGWRPWRIVDEAITTVSFYLDRGNFRPLGRMIEWSGHDLAGQLAIALRIPVNISLGVVRIASAATLAYVFVRLVERVSDTPLRSHSGTNLLIPASAVVIASALMVSHQSGPVNLFAWLYLGTSALVVASTFPFTSARLYEVGRMSTRDALTFATIGVALACTNEVTAIAVPLAGGVIMSRAVALNTVRLRNVLRTKAVRCWITMTIAFSAIFVPVRLSISQRCGIDDCYSASSATVTGRYPAVVVDRLITGAPPAQWYRGLQQGVPRSDLLHSLWSLVPWFALAIAPLILVTVRQAPFTRLSMPTFRQLGAVAITMTVLALTTAGLLGTSADLQTPPKAIGVPWRDSALITPAVASLLGILTIAVAKRVGFDFSRRFAVPLFGLLAIAVTMLSFLTTWSVISESSANRERRLNNEIALASVEFVGDELGNARRCELLNLWAVHFNDKGAEFRPAQLERALDQFVRYAHGADRFCLRDG